MNPYRHRVLICEDESLIRIWLRQELIARGFQVVGEARDGDSAIEQAVRLRPDLVFMDIKMPGPDGLAASEVIMRDAPTPIVILTAYADSDSIARALDAGVSYYLVKPIDAGQLEPAILMAEAKFRELMELRGQVASLEDALEQRKILDRAKGILMREMGVDEPGAHQLLQRLSSQMRKPVKDVAAEVIKANGKTFGSMKDE